MTKAKCIKCGGSAIADTFELARKLINHAVGLSRGIKCGDNYNMVQEIKSKLVAKNIPKVTTQKSETTKPEKTKLSTSSEKPKEKAKQTTSFI